MQNVPYTEAQILGILSSIADTPISMQENGGSRRFSGPVNRRTSVASTNSAQGSGTIYELKDEAFRHVLVRDWPEYSSEEKVHVSQRMEAALSRTDVDSSALAQSQIIPSSERGIKKDGDGQAAEDSSHDGASSKSGTEAHDEVHAPSSKKPATNSTKARLAKAAKGKSVPTTRGKRTDTAKATGKKDEAPQETSPVKEQQAPPKRKSMTNRSTEPSKTSARRKIEYTDSSDSDEQLATATKKSQTKNTKEKTSVISATHKERHGVGRGAMHVAEPWLDVHSAKDWHELAKRFRRVFGEYTTGMSRLQEEGELLQKELGNAHQEVESGRQQPTTRRQSTSAAKESTEEQIEEREEGEASPVREVREVDEAGTLTWRSATQKNGNPMSLKDMDTLVASLLDMEGQLHRMKGALQATKGKLQ